jgi:hypothetical protein
MKLSCIMETLTCLPCLHLWNVSNDGMLCLVVLAGRRLVVERPLLIGPFLSTEVLCGLWFLLSECDTTWDRVGQLGESGEYHMGRVRVVCFHIWSSEGGSPYLCKLRTALVEPWGTSIDYVLTHTGFMGSRKLRIFDGRWVGWHPTIKPDIKAFPPGPKRCGP